MYLGRYFFADANHARSGDCAGSHSTRGPSFSDCGSDQQRRPECADSVRGSDEISDLARSFNRMYLSLVKAIRMLEAE
jgi:HAMP domain-containing protein